MVDEAADTLAAKHEIRLDIDRAEAKKFRIYFPYEPYQGQLNMIKHVLTAILEKKNALLESPTGTGKSLALLVAALAYLQTHRRPQKIIYMSRTHSQLTQVIKELKKTVYRPLMTIHASKDHLCVNSELSHTKGAVRNRECESLMSRKKCPYYENLKARRDAEARLLARETFDIEDLITRG